MCCPDHDSITTKTWAVYACLWNMVNNATRFSRVAHEKNSDNDLVHLIMDNAYGFSDDLNNWGSFLEDRLLVSI